MDLVSFETPLEFKMFEEVMQQGEWASAHVRCVCENCGASVSQLCHQRGRKDSDRLREFAHTTGASSRNRDWAETRASECSTQCTMDDEDDNVTCKSPLRSALARPLARSRQHRLSFRGTTPHYNRNWRREQSRVRVIIRTIIVARLEVGSYNSVGRNRKCG